MTKKETLAYIIEEHKKGFTYQQIADDLNSLGCLNSFTHKKSKPDQWNFKSISLFALRNGYRVIHRKRKRKDTRRLTTKAPAVKTDNGVAAEFLKEIIQSNLKPETKLDLLRQYV